ncbi:MAG: hypothetical protein QM639_06225 [Rhodocyclaceae bacterium]
MPEYVMQFLFTRLNMRDVFHDCGGIVGKFVVRGGAVAVVAALGLVGCGGGGGGVEIGRGGASSSSGSSQSSSTGVRTTPEGLWNGKAGVWDMTALMLETNRFYVLYSRSGAIYGVVEGTANVSGSSFSASAKDFNIPYATVFPSSFTGSFTPMTSMSGQFTQAGSAYLYNATYVADYDKPVTTAGVAGRYVGSAATDSGPATITIVIDADGRISGTSPGYVSLCTFQGTMKPRASGKNVLDMTVTFNGGSCALGTATVSGNAVPVKDGNDTVLYAVGLLGDRSDGFVAVGTKQ